MSTTSSKSGGRDTNSSCEARAEQDGYLFVGTPEKTVVKSIHLVHWSSTSKCDYEMFHGLTVDPSAVSHVPSDHLTITKSSLVAARSPSASKSPEKNQPTSGFPSFQCQKNWWRSDNFSATSNKKSRGVAVPPERVCSASFPCSLKNAR